MPRPIRLQDVAGAAQVSLATASRSLSGAPGVSADVAARVREVADSLGYVANVHARTLAGGFTGSVGLVVHEIGDAYFTEIAGGVLSAGAERDLVVQICHTGRDPQQELRQLRTLIANRVGAIIVAGSGYEDARVQKPARAALQAYARTGGRVCVIGRHHLGTDAVLPDNIAGGSVIAGHLAERGHRRVAVLAGSRALTTVTDRLAGVRAAFQEAGMTIPDEAVIEADFNRAGGARAAARALEQLDGLTALIALSDDMALGALSVLRARGIAVPEQVSVTGFDDIAVAGDLAPALTTVRLPMARMGKQALELAMSDPASRPRRRRAAAELVVRDSTREVAA